jgi:hypothetical protein
VTEHRGFAAFAALAALVLVVACGREARALDLVGVDVEPGASATTVLLRLDGPSSPPDVDLLPERRLVVDLPGARLGMRARQLLGDGATVARVRLGEHPGYVRVVLDLLRDAAFEHRREGETVAVVVTPSGPPLARAAAAPRPRARPELRPTRGRPRSGTLLPSGESGTRTLLPGTMPPPASPGTLLAGSADAGSRQRVLFPGTEAPNRPGTLLARSHAEPEEGLLLSGAAALPVAEPSEPPEEGSDLGSDRATSEPAPRSDAEEIPEADAISEEEEAPGAGAAAREEVATAGEQAELAPVEPPPPPDGAGGPGDHVPALPPVPLARSGEVRDDREAREEARVSIEFRDADVRTVLDLVAKAGGYDVIFAPEVKGRVAVDAVDRPWREVFRSVLDRARLESVEHDDLILVSPASTGSR